MYYSAIISVQQIRFYKTITVPNRQRTLLQREGHKLQEIGRYTNHFVTQVVWGGIQATLGVALTTHIRHTAVRINVLWGNKNRGTKHLPFDRLLHHNSITLYITSSYNYMYTVFH